MHSSIRLAIISPQEVITRGLTAILSDYPDRVLVTVPPTIWSPMAGVQVVLYDTLGIHERGIGELGHLIGDTDARVLIYSRDMRPDLRARAAALGCTAWVSMSERGRELVEAIELVHLDRPLPPRPERLSTHVDLSPRGVEILALIAQGLSNEEIAEQLVLTNNTLKSHIRSIYRRIGVTTRAQAVGWAIRHGYAPPD